jgi:hypothetical protein
VAVNDYFAVVHGVATAVLSIAMNNNPGPVHKRTQVIAGSAKDFNLHWLIQVGANVSLPIDILKLNPLNSIRDCIPQPGVKLTVQDATGI